MALMERFRILNERCEYSMKTLYDIDLIIFSPPYNIGKEYESKSKIEPYLNWMQSLIPVMYKSLSLNGQLCINLGNFIDSGKVYPLDCLLFNYFTSAGFIPRNRIVWSFGHGLHCKNRFSGRHETVLWFTKSNDYLFNLDPVRIPSKYPNKKYFKGEKKGQLSGNPLGKNPGDVWEITNVKHNHPEKTDHPCQFPEQLVERFILSLTNPGDTVYDPFGGSGTTVSVAIKNGRIGVMSEIDTGYCEIALNRALKIAGHEPLSIAV